MAPDPVAEGPLEAQAGLGRQPDQRVVEGHHVDERLAVADDEDVAGARPEDAGHLLEVPGQEGEVRRGRRPPGGRHRLERDRALEAGGEVDRNGGILGADGPAAEGIEALPVGHAEQRAEPEVLQHHVVGVVDRVEIGR